VTPEHNPLDDVEPTEEEWDAHVASRPATPHAFTQESVMSENRPVVRVESVRIRNFKRISEGLLILTDPVTVVSGRNGSGKTSCIDGTAAAIGGAALCPPEPIRQGQDEAEVEVVFTTFVARRKWLRKPEGEVVTWLEVLSKDGAAFKKPQGKLDALRGALWFDPLEFLRMRPQEQAESLAKLAGVDLDAHTRKRVSLAADRTVANKTAKELRAQAAAVPPLGEDVPDAEVPLDEVLAELKGAEAIRSAVEQSFRAAEAARTRAALAQRRVDDLRAQLADAEADARRADLEFEAARIAHEQAPPVPDAEAIQARGMALEQLNRNVRAKQARAQKEKDALALEKLSREITVKIRDLDDELGRRVGAVDLGVPGLSVGESGVTHMGLPLVQASGAEKLRLSVAVGLKANPELRLMLIRDGSLLDAEGMRVLEEMVEKADAQVLIERVSDDDGPGIRIVDGRTLGPAELGLPAAAPQS
jgi:hypothetical protein